MNLRQLVDQLGSANLLVSAPDADPVIGGLVIDSRQMIPGGLFIALPGAVADGHDFIAQAAARGAAAVVAERKADTVLPVVLVSDSHRAAEVLAAAWYHHPAGSMRIFGVTGTNGKTTTTALLRHLLDTDGNAGSIGTIGAYDGQGRAVESTAGSLTTPGPVDLQATLRGLVDRGVKFVAMEASSHALAQRRLDAISFSGGVFTNLTRDHLDYHGSMDEYLGAKLRLASLVKGDGVLSVNADDPAWRGLDSDPRTITWGSSPDAALRITDLHALPGGSHFGIEGRFGKAEVQLPLPGDFNVSNAVAAAAIALGTGRSLEEVAARLATAPQVPGRMERIVNAPFHVVRDYAHTPDALERLLATLRPITPGRILLVFGCGGDRDRGKRPQMGAIAALGADVVFLTSDNPRTEDPEAILDDIAAGMPAGRYQREVDR
ncbi:MAG TPA: UDP-N-acetylmuramoyl-L-alanyl-D-glutamate--2,6-diaminopimelate ligase, partial [Gemmatimonadales bacterium]|nr:UDP-N-acetylmuramoyl-L-alanyl-D-glutamate--2,6-diaminopimelate ligase [Gemmatimonadales bacterium]